MSTPGILELCGVWEPLMALGVQGMGPSASRAVFGSEHLSPRCWADVFVLVSFLGRVIVVGNVLLICQTEVVETKSCSKEEELLGTCWEGLGTTAGPELGQLCHPGAALSC